MWELPAWQKTAIPEHFTIVVIRAVVLVAAPCQLGSKAPGYPVFSCLTWEGRVSVPHEAGLASNSVGSWATHLMPDRSCLTARVYTTLQRTNGLDEVIGRILGRRVEPCRRCRRTSGN